MLINPDAEHNESSLMRMLTVNIRPHRSLALVFIYTARGRTSVATDTLIVQHHGKHEAPQNHIGKNRSASVGSIMAIMWRAIGTPYPLGLL
jgi:hypothetical protein